MTRRFDDKKNIVESFVRNITIAKETATRETREKMRALGADEKCCTYDDESFNLLPVDES